MSEHAHPTFVDGCYRCDLGKDELQVSAHDVPLPEPVAWGIRDHAHGGWWLYEEDPGYEEGERVALIPAPAVEQYGRDSAAAERAAIVVWIESRTQTFRTELGLARVAGVVCPVLDLLAEGIADGEHLPGARGGEGT